MNPMNWNMPHEGVNVFQVIFVPFCALLGLRAIFRTWSGRVPRWSGVLGILVWSSAAISIALPDLTSSVANAVGIHRGADLVFIWRFWAGRARFYFYQQTRRLENLITSLVRREAIRDAQLGSQPRVDEADAGR